MRARGARLAGLVLGARASAAARRAARWARQVAASAGRGDDGERARRGGRRRARRSDAGGRRGAAVDARRAGRRGRLRDRRATARRPADAAGRASPPPRATDVARVHPHDVRGRRVPGLGVQHERAVVLGARRRTASRPTQFTVPAGGVGAGVTHVDRRRLAVRLRHHHQRRRRLQRRRPDELADPQLVPSTACRSSLSRPSRVGRRVYFVDGTKGRGPTTARPSRGSTCRRTRSSPSSQADVGVRRGDRRSVVSRAHERRRTGCSSSTATGTAVPDRDVAPSARRLDGPVDVPERRPPAGASSRPPAARGSSRTGTTGRRSAELRARERRGHLAAQRRPSRPVSAFGPTADQSAVRAPGTTAACSGRRRRSIDDAGGARASRASRLAWLLRRGDRRELRRERRTSTSRRTRRRPAATSPARRCGSTPTRRSASPPRAARAPSSTSVQVVNEEPPAVAGRHADAHLRRHRGSVGVAASSGFGYVLAQDDPMNQTVHVYIFAPSCGARRVSARCRRPHATAHAQRTSDVSYGWLIAALHGMTRAANACAPLSLRRDLARRSGSAPVARRCRRASSARSAPCASS